MLLHPWTKYWQYYSYFTDKETEAQWGRNLPKVTELERERQDQTYAIRSQRWLTIVVYCLLPGIFLSERMAPNHCRIRKTLGLLTLYVNAQETYRKNLWPARANVPTIQRSIHSFIHLFNKHLRAYCVLGIACNWEKNRTKSQKLFYHTWHGSTPKCTHRQLSKTTSPEGQYPFKTSGNSSVKSV